MVTACRIAKEMRYATGPSSHPGLRHLLNHMLQLALSDRWNSRGPRS